MAPSFKIMPACHDCILQILHIYIVASYSDVSGVVLKGAGFINALVRV